MDGVAYLNLIRGNTLPAYSGISKALATEKGKYAGDYSYISFGLQYAKIGTKFCKSAEPGDIVTLTVDCGKISPRRYKVKIGVMESLYDYGMVSTPELYEEGYEGPVKIKLLVTKKIDFSKLEHVARLYVIK